MIQRVQARSRWLLLAALLAGCSSMTPILSPSSSPPSSSQLPTPSTPPSIPASPSYSGQTGQLLVGFGYTDVLRVEVNGLAVRTAPDVDSPLAIGRRIDWTSTGDVRLSVGNLVSVDLGPLLIGDMTWYRVWPVGQDGPGSIQWDTIDNGPDIVEPGWVAASVGSDDYLSLHEASVPSPNLGRPPALLLSGTGEYLSEPQGAFDLFTLKWASAIDGQSAPCQFTVELVPVGGGVGDIAVDRSLTGAFEEDQEQLGPRPFEAYRLAVSSGCEWSLSLEPIDHD